MRKFATRTAAISAALLASALVTVSALAASAFEGTWKVSDTDGKSFEIMIAGDGTAKADRAGEGMKGTWKDDGSAAVITWDTGWTTKITKDGDKFKKTAFKKGDMEKPANSSPAEKVK